MAEYPKQRAGFQAVCCVEFPVLDYLADGFPLLCRIGVGSGLVVKYVAHELLVELFDAVADCIQMRVLARKRG